MEDKQIEEKKNMRKNKTNLDKAIFKMLAPLQQKGDSMTIGIPGGESVTVKFEEKEYFKPKANDICEKARKKTEREKLMQKMFFRQNRNLVDMAGRPKFGVDAARVEEKWREFKKFWRTGEKSKN